MMEKKVQEQTYTILTIYSLKIKKLIEYAVYVKSIVNIG